VLIPSFFACIGDNLIAIYFPLFALSQEKRKSPSKTPSHLL